MKQYILILSLALLFSICVKSSTAQNINDSTEQKFIELPFGKVTEERLVGSVDVITSEQLMHSGYPTISSALQGLVPGYANYRVRGFSRGNNNDAPLVIIDGLSNRSMGSISIDEVESIHILKDVTAKMLYGSRAANGVILIKTKRGLDAPKKFTVSADYGIRKANDYPEFLGAAEYMKYYNQALMNDGKDPLYSEEDISLAGTDYKHPDVDFYDMFVEDQTSYQKANAQLVGGDDRTQYFFNLGYLGENGLEKVGDKRRTDAFNIRSNLDYSVNDVISVNLDIAGQFYSVDGNHVSNSALFSALSSTKPNDYPIFISDFPHVDSLGTSDKVGGTNLYGDMVYSGYKKEKTSFAQTNFGMKFDLNKFVEGLSAKIYASFDMNNYISEGKILTYRTLKPAKTDDGLRDMLIVNGVYNPKGNEQKLADSYYRNMGGGATINFDRIFGDHALTADLSYLLDNKSVKTDADVMSTVQDDKTMNFGLRLNYAFQNKYIAEVASSYMGSTRFHKDNRWKLFNAVGLSYVLSEEGFMQNVGFIDFLKLKASFGKMGYDQSFDYLLYNDYYQHWSGNFKVGVKNAETLVGTEYSQSGNPNLTFEESEELNLGVSMRILGNRLSLSGEYFIEDRTGMPTEMKYAIPQMAGLPNIVDNYNAVQNKGYEISAQYTDKIGDFTYSFGGNMTSYKSEWTKYDELNQFSFQNIEGTATDAIWGYVADGFYTSAEDIATYGAENGVPLTSALGTIIPGDLKFKDLSDNYDEYTLDDNVINQYDRTIIGNSRPRFIYALNVNLHYKNFNFYALGQGYGDYDRMTTWPTYYTNNGNVKYSKFAREAAVPVFDEDGNAVGLASNDFSLPRLTTESSAHSYNASTFFLKKASFFKVRTVELSYSFPKNVASKLAAQDFTFYVRGDNVLTISDEKDLDPEAPASGLTSYPRFATISLGLKLGF